ncbi:uncharacterized protein LOC110869995 [Helianthus annuus]|uniref:uncharacterized protein LOC110869995 n=1 Tax=Helianthus annuus TaxID=4232 RepID=UPI000B90942A|nr:uncharacterized protein LOC110869995 [Helianthus annuus]
MELSGFDKAVGMGLEKGCESCFKDECLAIKLKAIKDEIKLWRSSEKIKEEEQMVTANENLQKKKIEEEAEMRSLTEQEIGMWQGYKKTIREWQKAKAKDLIQKSRIKWVAMGDENSTFFHTVVNSHKIRNRVNVLWIDGSWITDAKEIKDKFMAAFKDKFKEPISSRPRIGMDGFKSLTEDEKKGLIEQFKEEEIRNTIWECGGDKSPGPNGITITVIKT